MLMAFGFTGFVVESEELRRDAGEFGICRPTII